MNTRTTDRVSEQDAITHTHGQLAPRTTSPRQVALVAGVFYLLTFVSIPTLSLYAAVRGANYIVGPGPDTPALVGAVLELIVALAGIGTAVALYPVVKWQNESLALGFVAARTLEAATIIGGIASFVSIVTLRQAGVGPEASVIGQALVSLYDRFFFFGQSTIPVINALTLGILLYRSRLVPRWLPTLGFIGALMLTTFNIGMLFGLWPRESPLALITVLPIAIWEFSLGIRLVVRGFVPAAVRELLGAA